MLRYQDILSGQIVVRNKLAPLEVVRRVARDRLEPAEQAAGDGGPTLLDLLVSEGQIEAKDARLVQKAQALTQFVRAERLYAKIVLERGLVDKPTVQRCFEEQGRQRYKVRIASLLLDRGAITIEQNEQITDEELCRLSEEIERVEAAGLFALEGEPGSAGPRKGGAPRPPPAPVVQQPIAAPAAAAEVEAALEAAQPVAAPAVVAPAPLAQSDADGALHRTMEVDPPTRPPAATFMDSGTGPGIATPAAPAAVGGGDAASLEASVEGFDGLPGGAVAPEPDSAPYIAVHDPHDPLAAARALVGQTIAGRYRILDPIAEGGMGVVYRAEHCLMEKVLAFKVLHSALVQNQESVERFKREVRALSRFRHKNVVQIFDAGVGEGNIFYMAMEYVDGESLDLVLSRTYDLPIERAVNITRQALAAAGAAHELGIVHRDLKPSNIIVTQDRHGMDAVKIMDFGVVKMLEDDAEAIMRSAEEDGDDLDFLFKTQDGTVTGTPQYVSPEQASCRAVDGRSDIYSLGVILYEMLTGRLPFESESAIGYLGKHILEEVPPIAKVRPDLTLPDGLEAVLMKMLVKKPSQRYQTCGEVLDDLEGKVMTRMFGVSGIEPPAEPPREPEDDLIAPGDATQPVAPPIDAEPLDETVEADGPDDVPPAFPPPVEPGAPRATPQPLAPIAGTRPPRPSSPALVGAGAVSDTHDARRSSSGARQAEKPSRARALAIAGACALLTAAGLVGVSIYVRRNRHDTEVSDALAAVSGKAEAPAAELVASIAQAREVLAFYPEEKPLADALASLEQARAERLGLAEKRADQAWRSATEDEAAGEIDRALQDTRDAIAALAEAKALGSEQTDLDERIGLAEQALERLAVRQRFARTLGEVRGLLAEKKLDEAKPRLAELAEMGASTDDEKKALADAQALYGHEEQRAKAEERVAEGDLPGALGHLERALQQLEREDTRARLEELERRYEQSEKSGALDRIVRGLEQIVEGGDADPAAVPAQVAKAKELAAQVGEERLAYVTALEGRVTAALDTLARYRAAAGPWQALRRDPALATLEQLAAAEKALLAFIDAAGEVPHAARAQEDLAELRARRGEIEGEIAASARKKEEARLGTIERFRREAADREGKRDIETALDMTRKALKLTREGEPLHEQMLAEEKRLVRLVEIIEEIPDTFIRIPAGEFTMRSAGKKVKTGEYYIGRFELTQREWEPFVLDNPEFRPPEWPNNTVPAANRELPVGGVSYLMAKAYLEWRNRLTRQVRFRLPTEAEWERAAGGDEGLRFPWGNAFVAARASVGELRNVGALLEGDSPWGCRDMAGNLAEWTSSRSKDGKLVAKGGSYFNIEEKDLQCGARKLIESPDQRLPDLGIRLVLVFRHAD